MLGICEWSLGDDGRGERGGAQRTRRKATATVLIVWFGKFGCADSMVRTSSLRTALRVDSSHDSADRNAVLIQGVRICYLPHTRPSGGTPHALRCECHSQSVTGRRCRSWTSELQSSGLSRPKDPLRDERRVTGDEEADRGFERA